MKRRYTVVTAIILAGVLTACGQPEQTVEETKPMPDQTIEETKPMSDQAIEPSEIPDTENEEISFYGSWQVEDYRTCQIYALSQQEIEEFLTYEVAYDEGGFLLNGQPVELEHFEYAFADYMLEDIENDFCVDLTEWRDEKMTVPMGDIASDENFFGATFFPVDTDTLWIYYEGVFFRAERL
ncbi:MAG: hypothetical protein K2N01_08130 [Lachnospiraceae bacterium]|nr:hypothetical protein [Lachnospiraceae bacterium]